MDTEKAFWVICITLFIVIGINASIYVYFTRRRNQVSQAELFSKAAKRARSPWETEDEQLKELSQLVDQMKTKPLNADEHKDTNEQSH